MTTPREVSYPLSLSTAELACLLMMVEAPQLIGADNERLLPEGRVERDLLFTSGVQELEANRWLIKDPYHEMHQVTPELMSLISSLAFPQVALIVVVDTPDSARQGVNYALDEDIAVEWSQSDGRYTIVGLRSPDLVARRLAHMLKLPTESLESEPFQLSMQHFELARRDPFLLAGQALPSAVSGPFAATLIQPRLSAMLSFLRVSEAEIVDLSLLGIVAGGPDLAWLVTPEADDQLSFQAASAESFIAASTLLIQEFADLPVAL